MKPFAGPVLTFAAMLAACAAAGCGGSGGNGGGVAGLKSVLAPQTFNPHDKMDTAILALTPENGFSGTVTIALQTNVEEPGGFSQIPATVQLSAPGSPLSVSGSKEIDTPIEFSWSAWPVGKYEALATVTGPSVDIDVPIDITVTNTPSANAAVTTWHNDIMRTGAYGFETALSPSAVSGATFGKLFMQATDGAIEAEPLYMPGVTIAGKGVHNVVFIATMNAKVYAFDADDNTGTNSSPLWTANLGPAAPAGTGGGGDQYEQGIPSTPVVDTGTNTMYVVSKDIAGGTPEFRIHALDIGSGAEKLGGPVQITGTVNGTIGGVGGQVIFQAAQQYQRCGLLLLNGVVYVAAGGLNGDPPPCRGWIFGYNASTLQQTCVYTTAPDSGSGSQLAFAGGSIWMSGAGPASDGTYLYVATGNGDFDASSGGKDYGDSVLKLQPSGSTLSVTDSFTPYNQQHLNDADLDVGSGGIMLVPGTSLAVQLSKASVVFVLNKSNMGKYNPGGDTVQQEVNFPGSGFWCSPVYYSGSIYFTSEGGSLVGYRFSSAGVGSQVGSSSATFTEASPTISFNGIAASPAATAIVWAVSSEGGTAQLHAYSASTLAELYNSGSSAGGYMKFAVPTVANGKVYVPCSDGVYVFGLGGSSRARSKRR